MATRTTVVCDICATDVAGTTYTVTVDGTTRRVDACANHAQPIVDTAELLNEHGVLVVGGTGRRGRRGSATAATAERVTCGACGKEMSVRSKYRHAESEHGVRASTLTFTAVGAPTLAAVETTTAATETKESDTTAKETAPTKRAPARKRA